MFIDSFTCPYRTKYTLLIILFDAIKYCSLHLYLPWMKFYWISWQGVFETPPPHQSKNL